jgi:hypothetical protein
VGFLEAVRSLEGVEILTWAIHEIIDISPLLLAVAGFQGFETSQIDKKRISCVIRN